MMMLNLFKILMEMKGSDLHIISGRPPAVRVHGELTPVPGTERLSPDQVKNLIYEILTKEQIHHFEKDAENRYELDFGYGVQGVGRFRVNVHRTRGTIGVCIRALSVNIPKLEDLGLPPSVKAFTEAKRGLVLVTGPTGSGKSTTLAAIIDQINSTRNDHIITIEDPIEYLHGSKKCYVTQREVGMDADTLSFKNALKYALRQDPDVILVGEMRDYETIGIAITSAETGHLVFATLHTSGAAQTIDRIVDVFPADQQPQVRMQLAGNLLGVVSQILLPRVDKPGRILACELMFANFAIRNNIRSGKTESLFQTIQTSAGEGMQTLDQCLIRLVKEGAIDYETAKPYIFDKFTHETIKKIPPRPSFQRTQVSFARENPA
ncbi:MAG: type IV pilus twitching motility protein PilT [Candidatus Aminicenantes bacterium]|nr:type IV pilus twitching motility protein PilT [Candidatus Aminicenantes bacterium]